MGNVFAILKQDIRRLLKTPPALAIVIALMIFPSLYTWYNVVGFWDPYGNTSGMRVSIVNEDAGASSDLTGDMNLGDMIVEALKEKPELQWTFDDYDTAMADLNKGEAYAVFLIPEDFSQRLLALTDAQLEYPKIEYYVNEKISPVAPKITDVGSGMLEQGIGSAFVSKVSEAAFGAVQEALGEADGKITEGSSSAALAMGELLSSVQDARSDMSHVQDKLSSAQAKCEEVSTALDRSESLLEEGNVDLQQLLQDVAEAQSLIEEALPLASGAIDDAYYALAGLGALAEKLGYGDDVRQASELLKQSADHLFVEVIPAESSGLADINKVSAHLETSLDKQEMLISQTRMLVGQLDATLSDAQAAVDRTDALLAEAEGDLDTLRIDISALSNENLLSSFFEQSDLDAESFGAFLGSPTVVKTEKMYEVDTFGAGMAPLFMNLTFWIGTIMILVVMKEEVDEELLSGTRSWQRYMGRFLLFLIVAVMQAVVCCAVMPLLGVQILNLPALIFAAILASMAYLSITYALCIMFRHVGIGLCIILVFLQIPAATGLYPVEMTEAYYLALSPFFPLTYGIDAMREAMFGFYGLHYAKDVLTLLCLFVGALLAGVLCSPLLSNTNRTFAQQIRESGLYNGEQIVVPERRFRMAQLASVLIDRDDYRLRIIERYKRFRRAYAVLTPLFIIGCLLVPFVLSLIVSVVSGSKALVLGIWLFCVIVVFIALTAMETIRGGLERQLALSDMTDDEAKLLYDADRRRKASFGLFKTKGQAVRTAFASSRQGMESEGVSPSAQAFGFEGIDEASQTFGFEDGGVDESLPGFEFEDGGVGEAAQTFGFEDGGIGEAAQTSGFEGVGETMQTFEFEDGGTSEALPESVLENDSASFEVALPENTYAAKRFAEPVKLSSAGQLADLENALASLEAVLPENVSAAGRLADLESALASSEAAGKDPSDDLQGGAGRE